MTKSYFQKVAALWMFSWELSPISEGSSTFRKLYFKVATLNRALQSYFVSLLHWLFLGFRGTGGLLEYYSDRKFCCSPLFLKNCEILEKFRTKIVKLWAKRRLLWGTEKRCEVEWHTVKLWVLRYRNSPYSLRQITFLFKFQLDFIRFLENSLCFLSQHS